MKVHFLLWFFHIPRPQRTSLTMYMYMEKKTLYDFKTQAEHIEHMALNKGAF